MLCRLATDDCGGRKIFDFSGRSHHHPRQCNTDDHDFEFIGMNCILMDDCIVLH